MMKTREPVLVLPLGELAVLDMPTLAQRCAEQLQAGARLVTLFGRPDAEASWVATAILQGPDGALTALRAGFQTDVEPILAMARLRKGAAVDPVATYRASGYRAQVAAVRPKVTGGGGGIV